jgi:hypothetical protein
MKFMNPARSSSILLHALDKDLHAFGFAADVHRRVREPRSGNQAQEVVFGTKNEGPIEGVPEQRGIRMVRPEIPQEGRSAGRQLVMDVVQQPDDPVIRAPARPSCVRPQFPRVGRGEIKKSNAAPPGTPPYV